MAASREDIEGWFKRGVAEGMAYMLVICDSFDYSYYPSYFDTADAAKAAKLHPGEMQRVIEIYDLAADMQAQMFQFRAMAL